jgi:hypothetical protein
VSGCGRGDFAGIVCLRQFFYEEISLPRGILFLFAGYFDALADLDSGCVSDEVVVLVVTFIKKNDGIWGGGDATVERVGLSGFGKQQKRGAEQKGSERMPQR